MNEIMIPRKASRDILVNRFEIDHLQIIDSKNEKIIEKMVGSQLRFMQQAPLVWDFCLNMIAKAVLANSVQDHSSTHYRIELPIIAIEAYLSPIEDYDSKRDLRRKLKNNVFDSPVKLVYTRKNGDMVWGFPAICNIKRDIQSEDVFIEMLVEKAVFSPYIEKDWKSCDGFIKIPEFLHPIVSNACTEGSGIIKSTPHYRLQLLAFSKIQSGNMKSSSRGIAISEFKKCIVPEFYRKKKGLIKLRNKNPLLAKFDEDARRAPRDDVLEEFNGDERVRQHDYFSHGITKIGKGFKASGYDKIMLKNLYVGKKEVTLHFSGTPDSLKKKKI